MTIIKCSKCLKNIDEAANFCKYCGAPALSISSGDNQAQTKDTADKVLSESFDSETQTDMSESQMNREKFQSALTSTIDIRFAEIMASKKGSEAYLTYIDAQILTTKVRGIFKNALIVIPPQVENACVLSEKILAPSTKEKENRIKAAVGFAGGAAGIGIIIAAIVSAIWQGKPKIVLAFTNIFAPPPTYYWQIAFGVTGLSLAAVAAYYATRNSHQTDTERFLLDLKSSTSKAVDAIWSQYETELSRAITGESSSRG